jgi:hypothetical protein
MTPNLSGFPVSNFRQARLSPDDNHSRCPQPARHLMRKDVPV